MDKLRLHPIKEKKARKPAMFLKTTWMSPNGTVYNKLICNTERGGCGEEIWTDDQSKHRSTCFVEVPKKEVEKKICNKCGWTYHFLNHRC